MDLIEVTDNTNRHPWELSRCRCIIKEIKKLDNVEQVLDIGCGDGYFDKQLVLNDNRVKNLLGYDLYLKESYSEGKCIWTNDFSDVPDNSFDLILMMDVLEHIKYDVHFLRKISLKLKSNGIIIITVPAFMKLYSLHDIQLKHFRRYNKNTLRQVVEASNCTVLDLSYFYSILIPIRIMTMNHTEHLGMWGFHHNQFITQVIETILNFDFDLLRFFSKFHILIGGLSLLMIIRKNSND